jgi:hypothetical protein
VTIRSGDKYMPQYHREPSGDTAHTLHSVSPAENVTVASMEAMVPMSTRTSVDGLLLWPHQ